MRFFLYGTLMDKGMVSNLTGIPVNSIKFTPGILRHFNRYRVEGAHFPLIVASTDKKAFVQGYMWETENLDAIMALDQYEGNLYYKGHLPVVDGNGVTHQCWTYMPVFDKIKSSGEEWNYDSWKAGLV